MLFGTSIRLSRVQNFSVSIKGTILNRVTEYMYLGIVIDEVLSWKEHVHVSKAGKRIGMLRRIRKDLTVYAADKVYKAFIRPTMEYCDTVWTGCGKTSGYSGEIKTFYLSNGGHIGVTTGGHIGDFSGLTKKKGKTLSFN